MSRPEYIIKGDDQDGTSIHLADLMKREDGSYIVPSAPVFLAGIDLKLMNSNVHFAGLLAGTDNIFLNGYHNLTIETQTFKLRLNGEFHLIAGEMWNDDICHNFHLKSNALSFTGYAEFFVNNEPKFKGSSSGLIAMDERDNLDLNIDINTRLQDSVTLEIGTLKLIKIVYDTEMDIGTEYKSNRFDLQSQATALVEVYKGEVPSKIIQISEPVTICIFNIFRWEWECITIPAIEIEIPDISNCEWTDEPEIIDATLNVHVSNSGIQIHLDGPFDDLGIDGVISLTG